jgi:hypothetical protein
MTQDDYWDITTTQAAGIPLWKVGKRTTIKTTHHKEDTEIMANPDKVYFLAKKDELRQFREQCEHVAKSMHAHSSFHLHKDVLNDYERLLLEEEERRDTRSET